MENLPGSGAGIQEDDMTIQEALKIIQKSLPPNNLKKRRVVEFTFNRCPFVRGMYFVGSDKNAGRGKTIEEALIDYATELRDEK